MTGLPPKAGDIDPDSLVRTKSARHVRWMFDAISPTYDLLNHLLSGNIDRRWRRRLAATVLEHRPHRVLDVCTGTGDVALEICRRAREQQWPLQCVATDFARRMLNLAREKCQRSPLDQAHPLCLAMADTLHLPFADNTFDAVTVAFGIRNVEDLDAGLRELVRVTRSGGLVVILEFSHPRRPLLRELYRFYFTRVLPVLGWLFTGTKAYLYLPKSVSAFPEGEALAARLLAAGCRSAVYRPLSGGIATLYMAERQ